MKKISMLALLMLVLFGGLSTANAIVIDAGYEALYAFNFSSETVTPPYYGYDTRINYDYRLVDPVTNQGTLKNWLSDSTNTVGPAVSNWFVDQGATFSGGGASSPTILFSDDVIIGKIAVSEGSISVKNWELALQNRVLGSTTHTISGEFLSMNHPVPEPTTMLLFGAGLVGLAGFGRKKFKK